MCGNGPVRDIISPHDAAIDKIGGEGAANRWDPQSVTSSTTSKLGRWAGKEALMPVTEGRWWVDTVQGKNGNNVGDVFQSHDALHASSTKELNDNNWFANHPDETAAMVWSAGLASGEFGAGSAAAGGGAAGGAGGAASEEAALAGGSSIGYGSAGAEEAALAGGSSVGYGAGTGESIGSASGEEAALAGNSSIGYGSGGTSSGSSGLNSLSIEDSALGDSPAPTSSSNSSPTINETPKSGSKFSLKETLKDYNLAKSVLGAVSPLLSKKAMRGSEVGTASIGSTPNQVSDDTIQDQRFHTNRFAARGEAGGRSTSGLGSIYAAPTVNETQSPLASVQA